MNTVYYARLKQDFGADERWYKVDSRSARKIAERLAKDDPAIKDWKKQYRVLVCRKNGVVISGSILSLTSGRFVNETCPGFSSDVYLERDRFILKAPVPTESASPLAINR